MARRHGTEEDASIDMTPMLDVTFIMLIFFIVTTSFVKEAGLDVQRPEAATGDEKKSNIMIAVSPTGQIWAQKRQITLDAVRPYVEGVKAESPESSVIILADEDSPAGVVIQVMDQTRLAGITNISVATEKSAQ